MTRLDSLVRRMARTGSRWPRQDKKSVLAALGEGRGKSMLPERRAPQECGDIGLKIARDGTWYYQDSAIGRKPLVKLFASVLRREKDGQYYLVTPAEKALVHVEDAPFLAVAMEVEGSGKRQRLTFRTNLDETVEAGSEHPLSFRPEKNGSFTPFVLVRDGLQGAAHAAGLLRARRRRGDTREGGKRAWRVERRHFFPFPAHGARQGLNGRARRGAARFIGRRRYGAGPFLAKA